MATKKINCTKGKIAFLSANTHRVFKSYSIAHDDAKDYYKYILQMSNEDAEKFAHLDIYTVYMWLDKE